jgi:hypothetical protein
MFNSMNERFENVDLADRNPLRCGISYADLMRYLPLNLEQKYKSQADGLMDIGQVLKGEPCTRIAQCNRDRVLTTRPNEGWTWKSTMQPKSSDPLNTRLVSGFFVILTLRLGTRIAYNELVYRKRHHNHDASQSRGELRDYSRRQVPHIPRRSNYCDRGGKVPEVEEP